jgi:hypothetical protein
MQITPYWHTQSSENISWAKNISRTKNLGKLENPS